jgi:type VI secretion system secreted protein VgrG
MTETEHIELVFDCDASSATWTAQSAQLSERLDAPYRLLLNLATDDVAAQPIQLLGQPATLTITRGSMMRRITGIVSEVQEGSTHSEMVTTNIVVVPALEALRHRVNTKIFQEKTVPEILEEVLGAGLGAYDRSVDNRLTRTYPPCDFRVQYDESDLSFCSRLMEEEGIVSWFEFDGEAETLVLADSSDAHFEIASLHGPQCQFSLDEGQVGGHEYISELNVASQVRPTKVATRHFVWSAPSSFLESESTDTTGVGDWPSGAAVAPDREVYRHDEQPLTWEPGGTTYGTDLADRVRVQREAQVWEARIAEGRTSVSGMSAGGVFEMTGHPTPGFDGRYLVVSASHVFEAEGTLYENTISSVPADVPFRPRPVTPKPRIASVQTATVVGPAGEEIHTDEHGRIKVQFHWDRLGASDERSSCWVRVMQPWAGAGWGFVFIPRIGMEVVVKFVNGDPDQPLIIGSVFNGEHPLPYTLPDDKTKSTIKTETSLGGGGFNEIRFEDKAGSEEIFTHAQKDQNEVVENDHTTTVHHDQMIRVDNDQTQEVGNDQTEHVFNNQSLEVDANRTIQVHGNYDETIDGTETRQVTGDVSETFSANETRAVSANMDETISGNRTQTISGSSTETITGSLTQTITGGATINTAGSLTMTAAGGFTITAPGGVNITSLGRYTLVTPGGQKIVDCEQMTTGQRVASFFVKWNYKVSNTFSVAVFKMVYTSKANNIVGVKATMPMTQFKLSAQKKRDGMFNFTNKGGKFSLLATVQNVW